MRFPPATGMSAAARPGSIISARGLGNNCPPASGASFTLAKTLNGNPERIAASSEILQPRNSDAALDDWNAPGSSQNETNTRLCRWSKSELARSIRLSNWREKAAVALLLEDVPG